MSQNERSESQHEPLHEAIDRWLAGTPADAAAAELSDDERELLAAAGLLRTRKPKPASGFRRRLRRELVALSRTASDHDEPTTRGDILRLRSLGAAAMAAIVVLMLAGVGITRAQPGDALYPVRTAVEQHVVGPVAGLVGIDGGRATDGGGDGSGSNAPGPASDASGAVAAPDRDHEMASRGASSPTAVVRQQAADLGPPDDEPRLRTGRGPAAGGTASTRPAATRTVTLTDAANHRTATAIAFALIATATPSATTAPTKMATAVPSERPPSGPAPTDAPAPATATDHPPPLPSAAPTDTAVPRQTVQPTASATVSTPPTAAACRGVIAGIIRDPAGAPLAGAEVALHGPEDIRVTVTTAGDGRYRLEGLCAGSYLVTAAWGQPPDLVLVGFYDADGDGAPDPVVIEDTMPLQLGVDLVLAPVERAPSEPWFCRDPRGQISGHISQSAGTPAAGAVVLLFGERWLLGAQVTTDSNGDFRSPPLCLDRYEVFAHTADGASGVYDPDGDGIPDRVELTSDAPHAEGIDVQLGPPPAPPRLPPATGTPAPDMPSGASTY